MPALEKFISMFEKNLYNPEHQPGITAYQKKMYDYEVYLESLKSKSTEVQVHADSQTA